MAKLLSADAVGLTLSVLASVRTPADLEQLKVDRLLELRAVIDSLRDERNPDPPYAVSVG